MHRETTRRSLEYELGRTRSQEEANRVVEGWKESTRRFAQTQHREYAQSWHDHHSRQLLALEATFSALTARHRSERDRFAALLGISIPGDDPEVA